MSLHIGDGVVVVVHVVVVLNHLCPASQVMERFQPSTIIAVVVVVIVVVVVV